MLWSKSTWLAYLTHDLTRQLETRICAPAAALRPEACADVPPRQLVGAAATGQPEQESGAQLIAAARGSLLLRSVT